MISEKLKNFFGKVKDRREDIAKFTVKEAAGAIPFVGQIIKDAIDEFSPDEQEELIRELKKLSESQFEEISEMVGLSIEYSKEIRKITLYTFEKLQADHEEIIKKEDVIKKITEEIKESVLHLIEIQTREVKPPEIDIPKIQSVLEKEEIVEGEFFRREPKWIDFEEDFVVEREEVDEIIKKLESKNVQLVLGEPASGKSVILKNIGFKLAKKWHSVYIIELKNWSADRLESYFKEAQKIDDERTLIIVDDAHLQLSKCEGLVRDFRYKKLRTKLIIGSRDVKEVKKSLSEDYDFSTQESLFKNLVRTEIHAIDAAEEIISLFLKRKRGVSEKHQIAVSRGFDEYKRDLWLLAWSLMVYDKENTVNKERIYSAIANEKIKKINAEDVFLPLSVFYRFEIPIERDFLEEQLEIEKDKIDQLIKLSEISETEGRGGNEMLSLHHSSIADLYFKTYQAYPALGEKVKDKILNKNNDDLQYCLFYKYITSTDPRNAVDVVIYFMIYIGIVLVMGVAAIFSEIFLGKEKVEKSIRGGTEKEDEAVTLFKKLLGDKKVEKAVKEGIEKEENVEKIVMSM